MLCIGSAPLSGVPLIAARDVGVVDCGECVAVVCGEMPEIRRAAGVIVDGDAADIGGATGVQVITCGRCAKNTVSVTSDDGETLTLSLNRAVKTLCGVCEPLEQPVGRNGRSDFQCMAQFAAEILLGNVL